MICLASDIDVCGTCRFSDVIIYTYRRSARGRSGLISWDGSKAKSSLETMDGPSSLATRCLSRFGSRRAPNSERRSARSARASNRHGQLSPSLDVGRIEYYLPGLYCAFFFSLVWVLFLA